MIEREYTLRYSDLDKNGYVRTSSVMDLMQDMAIYHSAERGYSIDVLKNIHVAWLLQGWRVEFLGHLCVDKTVLIKTGVMDVVRFSSKRKYEIWQDGKLKIRATSDWFTVDTQAMRVILVPEQILESFESTLEEDNGFPFVKLRPDRDGVEEIGATKVEKRDLDTNNHMNNVKSAEVAMELLPEDFDVGELQITYRKALLPDETIKMCRKIREDGVWVELKNAQEETCVLLFAQPMKK
ncbi:MAG: hypothetical protein IKJ55_04335 [Clostridia bacterium]|nr:hypothetical protein [Clostridia bacterium]